jgi:hypothetical protein
MGVVPVSSRHTVEGEPLSPLPTPTRPVLEKQIERAATPADSSWFA